MFGNLFALSRFRDYMSNKEKELKKDNTIDMVCDQCSFCCHLRPGNLNHEDVEALAKNLGITKQEVFEKYLAVDDIKGIMCLLPIRVGQEHIAGEFMPSRNTFDTGPCIFLKDKKCELHDSAKPAGCRAMLCKNEDSAVIPPWTEEELKELGWDGCTEPEDSDY